MRGNNLINYFGRLLNSQGYTKILNKLKLFTPEKTANDINIVIFSYTLKFCTMTLCILQWWTN